MRCVLQQSTLKATIWIVFSIAAVVVAGCRGNTAGPAGDGQPAAIAADAATYQLKGIVVASDAAKGEVSIDSEANRAKMHANIPLTDEDRQPWLARCV